MTYAAHLIDAAKKAAGFRTYTDMATALDVDKGTLSNWRNGHGSPMPQERIIELCEMAGIKDSGPWLVAAQADAARSDAVRAALESVLDRVRPALAGVGLLVLGLAGFSTPYPAAATNLNDGHSVHYAQWRRRVRVALMRLAASWRHEPTALLA